MVNVSTLVGRPAMHPAFFFKVQILPTGGAVAQAAQMAKSEGLGRLIPLPDEAFQEVSGISMSIQTEEVKSGGDNDNVYKLPTKIQYPNLQLKRGLIAPTSELLMWCKSTVQGGLFSITLKNLLVTLINPRTSLATTEWKIINAYPIKYEISGFNAERNELVIEHMEFAYQRFEVQSVAMAGAANLAAQALGVGNVNAAVQGSITGATGISF